MSNFLGRLEIEMEKKLFSFLLFFLIIFIGIDVVVIILIQIQSLWVIYWYLIPLFVVLIFAGSIVDKWRRSIFLLLLIPEGLLTFVLAFVTDPFAMAILWIFIGVFSGFTIVSLLAYFADVTNIEQRGKIAGLISGIAFIVAAVILSWYSSTIFVLTVNILMFVFAIIKLIGGIIAIYLLIRKPEGSSEMIVSTSTGQGFMGTFKESYKFTWGNSTFRTYLIGFMMIWVAQGLFLPFGGLGQEAVQNYQQIASIGFAAGGLFLIVGGFMLDRSRKQIAFYGVILATISFVSYYFPIGAVFLAGIPILITTIIIIIGDIAPPDAKGRFFSIFLLFNFFAFFIGFHIGSLIAGTYDPLLGGPFVALACAIITGLATLIIYIWGKESHLEEAPFTERITPTPVFTSETPSTETFTSEDSI